MLSCGWLTSTTARLASTEAGRFFFHPVQLHLEPADLFVELRLQGLVVRGCGPTAVAEEVLGPGQHFLLPGMDQGRLALVLAGPLVDRLTLLECGPGHLGLDGRRG